MKEITIITYLIRKRKKKDNTQQGFLKEYEVVWECPERRKTYTLDGLRKEGEQITLSPICYMNEKVAYMNCKMGYAYTAYECVVLAPVIMERDSENNPIRVAELFLTKNTNPIMVREKEFARNGA